MKQPELGLKVIQLREEKGITQEQLAELGEVSIRTINRIETGEVKPRAYTMNNLSRVLEFDFNEERGDRDVIWITLLHLSSIFCIVPVPLLIRALKKSNSSINDHGKKAINFQLSMTIVLFVLAIIQGSITPLFITLVEQNPSFPHGILLLTALPVVLMIGTGVNCFVQGVVNSIRAAGNTSCKYLFSLPFLK